MTDYLYWTPSKDNYFVVIKPDKNTKVFISGKYKRKSEYLYHYHILHHSDEGTIISDNGNIYKFTTIFKIWNWGWYLAAKAKCLNLNLPDKIFPYKNESCCLPKIIDIINKNKIKLNGE